jgi:heat shock protein HtpX
LEEWWNITLEISPFILLFVFGWGAISFLFQKDIMFWLTGAKAITRKQNPEIYNIVENLCISKWLPMPKIAIIDEPWMNAFATWWRQKDSWIAFTSGLLQNLDKREIEAVAGHELTHLINKDSLLMYVAYVFVGVVSVVWQIIVRSGRSSSSSKKSWWIFVLGLAFLLLWYLLYPLVRLAISRKREYMADLWSVELTRDNQSMISALRKISSDSYVSKANENISWFFIAEIKRPSDITWRWLDDNNIWKKKIKTSIRDSHPSIDDRIDRLELSLGKSFLYFFFSFFIDWCYFLSLFF